ncbi:MAG: hypothetical protein L0228_13545 [Planctomycetes bacterium]|nr:hypothetical protein [Planctomycetota bacterium]
MSFFTRRRIRNASLLVLALAGIVWWVRAREQTLDSSALGTGYLLLAAVFFLASYNVRKKLPFLPLGGSTAWLQWHIYVGIGTVGVFALHARTAWPSGWLEALLAVTFYLTVGSGLVGLYLTRTIPPQLARVSDEITYERIPAFRRQVRRQAEEVVLESVAASGATTLADFYTARLYGFFAGARGWRYLVRPTSALRRALMREMQDVRRYLSEQEQIGCERLFTLVRRKDDLDFHDARQKVLKLWLFGHIGLTYALVLLAVLHGLLAHAFHGGVA